MYLDGGFEVAKDFVNRFIMTDIEHKHLFCDSKTILQEFVQSRHQVMRYELVGESGPDHDKSFTVEVHIEGDTVSLGKGRTKKAAEQAAAYNALLKLKPKKETT